MIKYLDLKKITELHADEIHHAVSNVVDSGWYLHGEANRLFEEHYARYIGTKHCIGCGNGLDALTLILRAYMELGVMKRGDEVIVPANTYIAYQYMPANIRCSALFWFIIPAFIYIFVITDR